VADGAEGTPTTNGRQRSRPGIRAFLLGMVLLPTLVTVALASSLAVSKWSERDDSVTTRSATLVLDALMHARAAVTDEYVPSAAIVYARSRGIGLAELDKLLNIPFGVDLTHARAEVGQSILSTDSQLSGDRAKLMNRPGIGDCSNP